MSKKKATLIVNFGGPRSLNEVDLFLRALLTDQDVVRTPFPPFLHRLLFNRVAQKRSIKVAADYALIGGRSPIFEDTEKVAAHLAREGQVLTFHRYLTATHASFKKMIEAQEYDEVRVFPLFPQFSYATTGSIARFFAKNLNERLVKRMNWVKSYPTHPAFVRAYQQCIRDFLLSEGLKEEETLLFFSAHGLPQKYVDRGDIYESECHLSYEAIGSAFNKGKKLLAYQSKFGRGEWLRPYTDEVCQDIVLKSEGMKNVVFIPLSFTSDHVETLFEIEFQYLPLVSERGLRAFRCPALNLRPDWLAAVREIVQGDASCDTHSLIRAN
jgi:protoporphyrin/coproporphyrin ferrochelatase